MRLLIATLTLSVAGLVLWYGGLAGVAYAGLYVLALVPGLPIGWRLFGRDQPAGWVAGAVVGYGLTALALWVPIRIAVAGPLTFGGAWLLLTAVVWGAGRGRHGALIPLPPWSRRETVAWLLVLHLVPVLLAVPLGRIGERDASGTRYYRAYFTADFIWHMALTQELARFETPPVNPYLAPEPIHYYWLYFVPPAAALGATTQPWIGVEQVLEVNALGTALILLSLVFFAGWSACGRAGPAAAACVLGVVAPSLEGLYEMVGLFRTGGPLDSLREVNIDAITTWRFGGLRIDDLPRSMWYTPQHATSIALGLIGVIAAARLERARPLTAWLVGTALGLSVIVNPLLGAAFCAVFGGVVVIDLVAGRQPWRALPVVALSVVPVGLGLAWCFWNGMSEGAGGAISIGWLYVARNAPAVTFLLSFGGVLIPVLLGCLPWRRVPWRPALPGVVGVAVGLFLMYFVSLTDRYWVGFRAGNVLLVTLPLLAARGFAGLTAGPARWRRTTAVTIGVVLLLAGGPTTVIDAYNAQDIENRRMGPSFLWTIPITPAQQAGFAWIRRSTPPDAIVQADPIARGRQNWSVMPSFAGRRMAAGEPISLLANPEDERRSRLVHAMLTELAPDAAYAQARALGIDYVWLDQDDGGEEATMARFGARPDLFAPMFRQGSVAIYRVVPSVGAMPR